jgi:hypothetical protein
LASDESRSPINPFEAAKARVSSDITVVWTAADVQALRPDWNPRECEEFLRGIAGRFGPAMVRMGLDVLKTLAHDPNLAKLKSAKKKQDS